MQSIDGNCDFEKQYCLKIWVCFVDQGNAQSNGFEHGTKTMQIGFIEINKSNNMERNNYSNSKCSSYKKKCQKNKKKRKLSRELSINLLEKKLSNAFLRIFSGFFMNLFDVLRPISVHSNMITAIIWQLYKVTGKKMK